MKKRILSLLLCATLALSITACGGATPASSAGAESTAPGESKATSETGGASGGAEIALITDVGTIDDKSFNQGSWEGVVQYADENNISKQYYKPTEKSDSAYLVSIDLAVKGGAKTIVCPGFLFENAVFEAQTKYPDVKFIFIDGSPKGADGKEQIENNVLSVYYAEEQAGFLAGYAAVLDGYRSLGFMGGIAVPAVVRYGYGFVQGADAAAAELGLKKDEVTMKYTYLGDFSPTPENMAKASAWYNEGTEVIFACAGGAGNSVMKAAETAGKVMIGVDVDQAAESETVITSSMKSLKKSVYDALTAIYDGSFAGGKSVVLDASSDGVGLPMENSRFKTFTQANYDELYSKLASGSLKVEKDDKNTEENGGSPAILTIKLVKVDFIK